MAVVGFLLLVSLGVLLVLLGGFYVTSLGSL